MAERMFRRAYVYADFYHKVMEWGSRMVWNGEIPRPPNRKNNFPYFLEEYTKKKKDE